MVTKKIGVALACVAFLSVSAVATLEAQIRGRTKKSARGTAAKARLNSSLPEMKNSGVMPARPPMLARLNVDPEFRVQIDEEIPSTPAEKTLHQDMATALSGYTVVPPARTTFFSGVTGYTLANWGGVVTDVTPIAGGYRVTATVAPCLITTGGTTAVVDGDYSEVFDVINGTVTYVSSQDPLGMAGQPQTIFVF